MQTCRMLAFLGDNEIRLNKGLDDAYQVISFLTYIQVLILSQIWCDTTVKALFKQLI